MKATYQKNHKKVLKFYELNKIDFNVIYDAADAYHESEDVNKKSQTISHWGGTYSNPFCNLFLYKINSLEQLEISDVVFCRDGLFSLIDFFYKFPRPQNLRTTLMINSTFQEFIPLAWLKNVVFYEIGLHSLLNYIPIEDKRDSLIVKGALLAGNGTDVKFQEEILAQLAKIKLAKYKKVKIFLWGRENYFLNDQWLGDNDYTNKLNSFYPKLMELTKKHSNVSFTNFSEMMSLKNYHHYKYVDLNKKEYYIGDDYIDFLFLSKGILPEKQMEKKKISNDSFFALSAYHGIHLIGAENLVEKKISSKAKSISSILEKFELKSAYPLNFEVYRYIACRYDFEYTSGVREFERISSK